MDWNQIVGYLDRTLNTVLVSISGRDVTAVSLLIFVLIIAVTFKVSKLAQRGVERAFALRGVTDPGMTGNVNKLLHYAALAIGFALALQNLGFDLGALFAAGAIFAVALGFAMQGLVQNFVSGVILLGERTIKNGDVLEVEGEIVRVTRMGLRMTVARTRDEEDLIIPNTTLAQNTIKNFTLRALPGKYSPPSFALDLAYKDLHLALELGDELGVPLYQGASTHNLQRLAKGMGWGPDDSTSVLRVYESMLGRKVKS